MTTIQSQFEARWLTRLYNPRTAAPIPGCHPLQILTYRVARYRDVKSHHNSSSTLPVHERRSCVQSHSPRKTNRGADPKCVRRSQNFQQRQQRKPEQRAGSRSCISGDVSVYAHLPNRLTLSAVVGPKSHKPPFREGDEQGFRVFFNTV